MEKLEQKTCPLCGQDKFIVLSNRDGTKTAYCSTENCEYSTIIEKAGILVK